MPSSPEQRRSAAETVLARMRSAGVTLDSDPEVGDLIDQWINGRLGMPEVLDRYQQLLKDRHAGRRRGAASLLAAQWGEHILLATADLLQEAEKDAKVSAHAPTDQDDAAAINQKRPATGQGDGSR